jgi:signal transduction histidine kinase
LTSILARIMRNQEKVIEAPLRPARRIREIANEMLELCQLLEDALLRGDPGDLDEWVREEYQQRRRRLHDLRLELAKFISQPS